ncbi:hypothetical protein GCM10023238_29490 [Streptomyces heliomycini]
MEIDEGTLGRSARGKVPLRDDDGGIVGAVSVGHRLQQRPGRLIHAIPGLFAYAGGALAVGRARGLADLPAGAAADPRPGLLRHRGAARGA